MSQADYTLPPIETSEERRELWSHIDEAGGVRAYIRQEIHRQDLAATGNPEHMNASQRQRYKQAKKLEAEFRTALRKRTWAAYRETHLVHLGDDIFYNDLIDIDAFDIDNREQRREANDIPSIETVDELATFLGLTIPELRWLSYHRNAEASPHYVQFSIPKADGSRRVISAPKPKLKACQTKIYHEILSLLPVHGAAHGFVPGRSIATHASLHAGGNIIVKMDIRHFFPTIVFPRVKGFFRKIGYPEQVATVMALLCTESPRQEMEHKGQVLHVALQERCLPQGAPTSPTLTNLMCVRLDRRVLGLARKLGWTYSRYADDLAFSWHQDSEPDLAQLLGCTKAIAGDEGFKIHPKKTQVMRAKSRQMVTGLVLNATGGDEPNHPRPVRRLVRQIRAAIHNRKNGKPGKAGESLLQLQGLAAFVCQTDPRRGEPLMEDIRALIAAELAE
ncbi:MAG: RNA-directed DNA polymerase [Deltaproteobacteria bacterium]|nr:MAG: RNA-directed DNA polymerase [Deltaproteobacteria bacterium]